jgi:hypothetical protein
MGIGGIETGVRDIAKYLNKKKIDNYILCERSNKNFNNKGLKIIKLDKDKENQSKIESFKVSKDLYEFDLLSKAMVVKLAESDIKTLDDFAGLTTDDLIGYLEIKGDKNSKVTGLLEEFNLTREEGDQLIMEARKIWLD